MSPHAPLPPELLVVGLSVVLLSVHIGLQAGLSVRERGLEWAAGSRDEARPLASPISARAHRALENFKETYPVFLGLALALVASGRAEETGAIGAWVWFGARVLYLPLYLTGTRLRPVIYVISLGGIITMTWALLAP